MPTRRHYGEIHIVCLEERCVRAGIGWVEVLHGAADIHNAFFH